MRGASFKWAERFIILQWSIAYLWHCPRDYGDTVCYLAYKFGKAGKYFLNGPLPASFLYFLLSWSVNSKLCTNCLCLHSNPGRLMTKPTTLPTVPPPLLMGVKMYHYVLDQIFRFFKLRCWVTISIKMNLFGWHCLTLSITAKFGPRLNFPHQVLSSTYSNVGSCKSESAANNLVIFNKSFKVRT